MKDLAFYRLALILGLISAIGPFAIDMYLPALPELGRDFHAADGGVQITLTVFFLATGVGQLTYGPLSDRFGRKPLLFVGLLIFTLASIGCALAPDLHSFSWLRFLEGLGAAGCTVITRAIVRDHYSGVDATRMMSLLILIFSVCPVLAPMTGSFLMQLGGWRAIFWMVAFAGICGIVLTATLKESRRAHVCAPQGGVFRATFAAYDTLLRDWHFLGIVGMGGFAMAGFFAYLATSSFVFIQHYGFSEHQYSLAFALNAIAFTAVAQLNGKLCARFGLARVVRTALALCLGFVLTLLIVSGLTDLPAWALMALVFCCSAMMGCVNPVTAVLALEDHPHIAGAAAALMGALQMLVGGLGMAFAGYINDDTPFPMACGMAVGVALAFTLACFTLSAHDSRRLSA